jgi:hypothetical protein
METRFYVRRGDAKDFSLASKHGRHNQTEFVMVNSAATLELAQL